MKFSVRQISCAMGISISLCLTSVAKADDLPYVKIAPVQELNWAESISLIGTVQAAEGVEVSSPVPGVINTINFTSGKSVKKGDVLVELNNADLQATVQQDTLKYQLDNQQFQSYKKLYTKHLISTIGFANYLATMKEAQAQLNRDQALLNKTIIRAPFSGVLGIQKVEVGQYIAAGTAIVSLQDINKLYVNFSVPEKLTDSVHLGDLVSLSSVQTQSHQWSATITAMDSNLDADTKSLLTQTTVNPPSDGLLPGMFVQVKFLLAKQKPVLVVPQEAVNYQPGGEYVYIYKNSKT